MIRALLVLSLLGIAPARAQPFAQPVPVLAQPVAQAVAGPAKIPDTIELPTELLASLRQYLGTQPHDQVASGIAKIEACIAIQTPRNGVLVDRGECPAVSKVRAERAAGVKAMPPAPSPDAPPPAATDAPKPQ